MVRASKSDLVKVFERTRPTKRQNPTEGTYKSLSPIIVPTT